MLAHPAAWQLVLVGPDMQNASRIHDGNARFFVGIGCLGGDYALLHEWIVVDPLLCNWLEATIIY